MPKPRPSQQEIAGQGPGPGRPAKLGPSDRFEPVRLRSPSACSGPATGFTMGEELSNAKGGKRADAWIPEPRPRCLTALRGLPAGVSGPKHQGPPGFSSFSPPPRFQAPRRRARRFAEQTDQQTEPALGAAHAQHRRRCRRHAAADAARPPQSGPPPSGGIDAGQQAPARAGRRMQKTERTRSSF